MTVIPTMKVEGLLDMEGLMREMERAFREFLEGRVMMPKRMILDVPGKGNALYMPALVQGYMGFKVITIYPSNADKGLQTSYALMILQDGETGMPLAVIDGDVLTAYRTGAVTGIAAKHLAREDARIIGIIGAGRQARTQLLALTKATGARDVIVYDVDREAAMSYTSWTAGMGLTASVLETPEDVAKRSDILVLATTSKDPVIRGDWLRNGELLISIGWAGASSREVDDSTLLTSDKIVVDSIEAALEESGDIRIPLEKGIIDRRSIYAELGEIVAGRKRGREGRDEKIFFKSVGLAFEDVVAAKYVYEKVSATKSSRGPL